MYTIVHKFLQVASILYKVVYFAAKITKHFEVNYKNNNYCLIIFPLLEKVFDLIL